MCTNCFPLTDNIGLKSIPVHLKAAYSLKSEKVSVNSATLTITSHTPYQTDDVAATQAMTIISHNL